MKKITYYDFDLDLSADQRWKAILEAHDSLLENIRNHLTLILYQYGTLLSFVKPILSLIGRNNVLYYDEILSIAHAIKMDPYHIVLMQLVYESSSACTAAILDIRGKKLFFRTMDWPFDFLKDTTIGLNIKKNGQLIGKAITFVGYVGFLTATNAIDHYTIAINYRRTQNISLASIIKNFYRTLTMKWPIGYLVRNVIETTVPKDQLVNKLSQASLISPCYITIYMRHDISSIITRDCDKAVNIRTNELVQTNCDWNKTEPNILYSLERIKAVKDVQKLLETEKNVSKKQILRKLFRHPILNKETIYVHLEYAGKSHTFIRKN